MNADILEFFTALLIRPHFNLICYLVVGSLVCFLLRYFFSHFIKGAKCLDFVFSNFHIRNNSILKWTVLLACLCGIIIYAIGFYQTELTPSSFWGNVGYGATLFIRSTISSLEMFVLHSDLLEVEPNLHKEPMYMFFFVLVHLVAYILSIGFVLSFVAYKSLVRVKLKSWRHDDKNIFIFWNINEGTKRLAHSIRQNALKEGKEVHIVYVYDNDHEDEQSRRMIFNHLLDMSHVSRYDIRQAENVNGVLVEYEGDKTLKEFQKLINEKSKLRFFFLSEDEDFNLRKFDDIYSNPIFKNDKQDLKFYCVASNHLRNYATQYKILFDTHHNGAIDSKNKTLTIIDTSDLAVHSLRIDPEAHPVRFVDLEMEKVGETLRPTGIVTSEFNSLIIGFGETGQEALSFLYEFSAFVGPDHQRSPFSCTVLDQQMERIEGNLYAQKPNILKNDHIFFKQMSVGSLKYWNLIDNMIDKLNYVVISLGDENENTNTAIQLYNYILRKRGSLPKHFVIYTRLYDCLDTIPESVSAVYRYQGKDIIRFFGEVEQIFNYDIIINDKFSIESKTFEKEYNKLTHTKYQDDIYSSASGFSLENFRKQRKGYLQNLGNAYHKNTKAYLIGGGDKELTQKLVLELHALKRFPDTKEFTGTYWYDAPDSFNTKLMTNLAICEHLRWNAAMENLGYTYSKDEKNDMKMVHKCLTTWEGLHLIWSNCKNPNNKKDEEFKRNDFNVVETSIQLLKKDIEAEEKGNTIK